MPKYRRRSIYGALRRDIRGIARDLCQQRVLRSWRGMQFRTLSICARSSRRSSLRQTQRDFCSSALVSGCLCFGRRACLVSTPATCKSNGQRKCSGTGPYGPRQCWSLDLAGWRKERLAAPPAGAAELSRIRYAKSSRRYGRRGTLQLPLLLRRHQVPFCLDFMTGGSGADGSSAGLRQLPRRRDAQ